MGKRKNKERKSEKSNRVRVIGIVSVVLVISVALGYMLAGGPSSAGPKALGGETRPTMSPAHFVGKTSASYRAAREIPEILDKIYCYCQCQDNFGHKSLLTCFVDRHGSQCGICMDEALMAHDMHKKGHDAKTIVERVNSYFAKKTRRS